MLLLLFGGLGARNVEAFVGLRSLGRLRDGGLIPQGVLAASEGESMESVEVGGEEMDSEDVVVNAMQLLDVMTCSVDEDAPEYDVDKDVRRDEMLFQNDYESLKVELRQRGLRINGDKPEMIIRLLLNIIDPSVKYNTLSGMEPNLQYINQTDIDQGDVTVLNEADRQLMQDSEPDAEDVKVLGGRNKRSHSRSAMRGVSGMGGGAANNEDDRKLVMDGLSRRELEFLPLEVTRASEVVSQQDKGRTVRAYVSGGRDVLRSWERRSTVVVVLPDERGWRDKDVRVFADEIAFNNQVVVMVPDIHSGTAMGAEEYTSMADEDVQAWRRDADLPGNRARLLDDVVASLHFAREEYGAQALGIAGVGHGAGRALMVCSYFGQLQQAISGSPSDRVATASKILTNTAVAADESFMKEVEEARRMGGLVASGLLSDGSKVTTDELLQLAPKACFAVTPEHYSVDTTVAGLTCAPFIVLGSEDDTSSSALQQALVARGSAVPDFSIRVYESRGGTDRKDFVHRAVDELDTKAAQEALAIGCIWLDIFARDEVDDMTIGVGGTKDSDSALVFVSMDDLVNPVRSSAVAAYLHDDPDFVRNMALEKDVRLKRGFETMLDKQQGEVEEDEEEEGEKEERGQ